MLIEKEPYASEFGNTWICSLKFVGAEPDNSTVMHLFVRHSCAWFCQTNGRQPGVFGESYVKRLLHGLGKELPWA